MLVSQLQPLRDLGYLTHWNGTTGLVGNAANEEAVVAGHEGVSLDGDLRVVLVVSHW
jgi:hypothetical protein